MDRIPGIFTYNDEGYIIHLHRGVGLNVILHDVCDRWKLNHEQLELRCVIPERPNSSMRILNGDDIDRMIDMHMLVGSKVMNVEVFIRGDEEVAMARITFISDRCKGLLEAIPQVDSCTFFMWCDELQDFVVPSSSRCCCHKDDRIKCLETRVYALERELEYYKSVLKKSRTLVQILSTNLSDVDGGSDSDSDIAESLSGILSLSS